MTPALRDVVSRSAPPGRWSPELVDRLATALDSAFDRARAAWPGVELDDETFLRAVLAQLVDADDPLAGLELLRVEELYLCRACLAGSALAVEELDRRYVTEAARALGRVGLDATAREEALQHAREKLLTPSAGSEPKLAQFSGRGSLAGWIRVVVVRTALNTRRHERRHVTRDDDVLASRIAEDAADPELEVIKVQYADKLATSVSEAFRRLTSEQRNLLRLYVIDQLSLADLGRLHNVDASTISRWLSKIRAKLLAEARGLLLARHAMRPSECESLMRLVQSDLHVSIARLLQTETPGTADE